LRSIYQLHVPLKSSCYVSLCRPRNLWPSFATIAASSQSPSFGGCFSPQDASRTARALTTAERPRHTNKPTWRNGPKTTPAHTKHHVGTGLVGKTPTKTTTFARGYICWNALERARSRPPPELVVDRRDVLKAVWQLPTSLWHDMAVPSGHRAPVAESRTTDPYEPDHS
jgi:hypothetical protein